MKHSPNILRYLGVVAAITLVLFMAISQNPPALATGGDVPELDTVERVEKRPARPNPIDGSAIALPDDAVQQLSPSEPIIPQKTPVPIMPTKIPGPIIPTPEPIKPTEPPEPVPPSEPPVLIPVPLDVKIRRVDFTDNLEVTRDRSEKSVQSISDFDGDEVEWKDDDCDGTANKNWPVAYKRASKVTLDIQLCVTVPKGASVTATIRGEAKGKNLSLVFNKTGVRLVNGINLVADLKSEGTLPDAIIIIEPMTIKWEVISPVKMDVGGSTHNTYVTLETPKYGPLYYTLLDLTNHNADGETDEIGTFNKIWGEFTDRQVRRREFNPITGQIDRNGALLSYYDPANKGFATCDFIEIEDLLEERIGQCGAWAKLFQYALSIHGIKSDYDTIYSYATNMSPSSQYFLVKNWQLAGCMLPSGDLDFPLKFTEVELAACDQPGLPGQTNPDPTSWFGNHQVVIYPSGGQQIYDPSYGKVFANRAAWRAASVAAFCSGPFPSYAGFSAKCVAEPVVITSPPTPPLTVPPVIPPVVLPLPVHDVSASIQASNTGGPGSRDLGSLFRAGVPAGSPPVDLIHLNKNVVREIDVVLQVTNKGNQTESLDATLSIVRVPNGCGAIFNANSVNGPLDTTYVPGATKTAVVEVSLLCQNPGLSAPGDNFVLKISVPHPDDTNPADNQDSLSFAVLNSQ